MTIKAINLQVVNYDNMPELQHKLNVDISGLQYFRDLEILFIRYFNGYAYITYNDDVTGLERYIKYFNTLNLPCCLKHLFILFHQSYSNKKHLSTNGIIEIFNKLRLPSGCELTINILIYDNDHTNDLTHINCRHLTTDTPTLHPPCTPKLASARTCDSAPW